MAKDLYLSEGRVMGPDGQLDLATAFPNDPVVNATSAYAANEDDPSGFDTFSRWHITSSINLTSQLVMFGPGFTAPSSWTCDELTTASGSTASSGLTLAKLGLYRVEVTGDLTLLGSCASDTTLFNATNSLFTRSLTSPVSVVAGERYMPAILCVGTTAGSVRTTNPLAGAAGLEPALGKSKSGQSDLPASLTVIDQSGFQGCGWFRVGKA